MNKWLNERRALVRWLATVWLMVVAGAVLAAEPLPKKLRIASVAYFQGDRPVYTGAAAVVAQQGWLAEELRKRGVELEWFPAPTSAVGPIINEAFANGTIDFAGYGDLPAIIVNAGGVETRVVVPNGFGQDTFLVVPTASQVKTLADLKGKRIAVHRGRPWELPFSRLVHEQGFSYGDFKIYNVNPNAGAAAIAAGGVDALYTLSDAYLLEDKGVGRIIWSTKQAPGDWKMRAELWGAKEFIDRYPELTQLVATAYVKAAYWSAQAENEDAMVAIATRNGQPESVVRREYDDPATPWKQRFSPLFADYVLDHYRHAVDYALDKKLIRRKLTAEQLVEPRFVETALRELQLENFWNESKALADRKQP